MKLISVFLLIIAALSVSAYSQKTKKIDLAKKIADATPAMLPQTPVLAKIRTDAEDENLKGKVKAIIEESTTPGARQRERSFEFYYNENGNLLKEVSYLDGYPEEVIVWGYIDGKRVQKTGQIIYEEGERPPADGFDLETSEEQVAIDPNTPRDRRYGLEIRYKYDDRGRLIEKWTYQNNGEVFGHTEYVYTGNQREVSYFGADGSRWTRKFEILDKSGNVIQEYSIRDGKKTDISDYSYQFDAEGNWIVSKAVETKTIKGKKVLKTLWTSYRTITYYK